MKRLVTFCVGVLFSAIGLLVFAASAAANLHAGQAVIALRVRHRLIWMQVYAFRDHPVYFVLEVLKDVSGAVALGGLGLLLMYAAVRLILDPSGANVTPRAGRIGSVWAFVCLGSFTLFLALETLPILLKYGILS